MAAPGTPVFEAVESPPRSLAKEMASSPAKQMASSPAKQMAGSVASEVGRTRFGRRAGQDRVLL